MELLFIRHGQGEHNLDVPDRLNIPHPRLTQRGKAQVAALQAQFTLLDEDVIVVSPTIRTLETAAILTGNFKTSTTYVSPLVGPRMYPFKTEWPTYGCDFSLSEERITKEFPTFKLVHNDETSFGGDGINRVDQNTFSELGNKLIRWMILQHTQRAIIISHDGTITNYRQLLGETGLTRSDFLGEAGTYRIMLPYTEEVSKHENL